MYMCVYEAKFDTMNMYWTCMPREMKNTELRDLSKSICVFFLSVPVINILLSLWLSTRKGP